MRTPEQIQNLKRAFSYTFGPGIIFFPDSVIDMMAQRLMKDINPPKIWSIKIRFTKQKDTPWEQINPEPKNPLYRYDQIADKCYSLLIRYPEIDSIQISDGEHADEFSRDH
jgi:hypothetical protein